MKRLEKVSVNKGKAVTLLGLAGFIVMADNWVVSPILPAISNNLGIDIARADSLLVALLLGAGSPSNPPYRPKIPATYRAAVKMMIPESIHLMALAGTNFWRRAPRYIPAVPPMPKRKPRNQSGATEVVGK